MSTGPDLLDDLVTASMRAHRVAAGMMQWTEPTAAVGTGQPIPIKPYLSVTLDPIGKTGMLTLGVGKLARIPGFEGGPFPYLS